MASSLNLPVIQVENHLQSLLEDERERGEQHKKNYQCLKADHSRLKEEHRKVHHAMHELSSNLQRSQEASQQALQNAQAALNDKQTELLNLKDQIKTVDGQDAAGSQEFLGAGVNARQIQRLKDLELECETLRHEASRLKHLHEMMIAQSQFDLLKTKRKAKEMHTRHSIQLQAAEEVNKSLSAESLNVSHREEDLRILERENINLKTKLRSLMTEQESIRSSTEESTAKSEAIIKEHLRANVLQATSLRELQSEKNYLKLQREALLEEIASSRKEYLALKTQCSSLQKELSQARNTLASSKYERLELAEQLRASFNEKLGHISAEKEAVTSQLNSVQLELKLSQAAFEKQVTLYKETETKWERKLEATFEEQLTVQRKSQDDRRSLEKTIDEYEKQNEKLEDKHKNVVLSFEVKLKSLQEEKSELVSEREILRKKIHNYEMDLAREKQLRGDSQKKYTELEVQVEELQAQVSVQTRQLESQTEEIHHQLQKINTLMQQKARQQQTIKDLKSKKKSISNNVNEEEHKKVIESLQELQKKHHLFRSILSTATSDE